MQISPRYTPKSQEAPATISGLYICVRIIFVRKSGRRRKIEFSLSKHNTDQTEIDQCAGHASICGLWSDECIYNFASEWKNKNKTKYENSYKNIIAHLINMLCARIDSGQEHILHRHMYAYMHTIHSSAARTHYLIHIFDLIIFFSFFLCSFYILYFLFLLFHLHKLKALPVQ